MPMDADRVDEEWLVRQHERTFLVIASEEFEAVVRHPDEEPIVGSAWFGADELRSSSEVVYPEGVADLVQEVSG
jgi:hypothetical protein